MYNNVRWLSRRLALKRFVECFNEIKIFLNDRNISYPELLNPKWASKRRFFAYFCEHLNDLNVKLQGKGKILDVTFGYIRNFEKNSKYLRKIFKMKDLNTFQTSKSQEAIFKHYGISS